MGSLIATADHNFVPDFPHFPISGYSMPCLLTASPPLSFLPSRAKYVGVMAGNPFLRRRQSLLRVGCRTNRRLVSAAAIFQPGYFSSVAFPVRIFNRPPGSSGSVVVIAFLVSSVFAALVFILKSGRKRRISERKIVSYDGSGVQLRPDHAAVSCESLLRASGARISFSNEGMQEEVTQVCDSIGRPRRDSVISSLINSSTAFGRGLEPQGLGLRDSLMFSSPFQKTSASEFGEVGNCIVSRDAVTYGTSNAMAVHRQLLDDAKKLSKAVPIDKELIYFQNGVSERLCDDRETAGNGNPAEIHLRLINDGMGGSEEAEGKRSQLVSSVTKLAVDYNADEISDQLIDEGKEENDMVAEVGGELFSSLYEDSKMASSNSEIDGDSIAKEIDLRTIDVEKGERSRPLVDDERARNEEFTKLCDKSIVFLHEESELTTGVEEMEGNVLKQNLPQTMEGETKMRDKATEASSESTEYHNEEDVHEPMAVPIHSSRNPMPVMPLSSEFVVDSRLRSSTTDEQEEISDEDALQGAMPAIAMGAGILGMLATGVHGGLEMVGFVAATSFIAYDLLWASNRKRWWNDITKVTNREELMILLRSRNIIKDV